MSTNPTVRAKTALNGLGPRGVSGYLVEIIISGHQLLFDPVSAEFGKVFFRNCSYQLMDEILNYLEIS